MSKELQIPTGKPEKKTPLYVADEEKAAKCYAFKRALASEPRPHWLKKTPDGKAYHIPIDIIQNTADRLFYLGWGTENITTSVISNEVTCTLTLWYIHPVTGLKITQTGAAAAQITVDAIDKDEKALMTKQQINLHSTNIANKKANALHLVFPKVVIEAEKNAFKKLGNVFGRHLNREHLGTELQKDKVMDNVVEVIQSRPTDIPEDFVQMVEKCHNLAEVRMLNEQYCHLFEAGTYQYEVSVLQTKYAELSTLKQIS